MPWQFQNCFKLTSILLQKYNTLKTIFSWTKDSFKFSLSLFKTRLLPNNFKINWKLQDNQNNSSHYNIKTILRLLKNTENINKEILRDIGLRHVQDCLKSINAVISM